MWLVWKLGWLVCQFFCQFIAVINLPDQIIQKHKRSSFSLQNISMQLWIKKQILTLGPFGHMNHPNYAIRLASTNRSRLGEGHTLPNQLISPLKWIKCSVPHININWWNRLLPEWECAIGMLMKNTFHLSTFDRSKSNRTSFAVFGSPFSTASERERNLCSVWNQQFVWNKMLFAV